LCHVKNKPTFSTMKNEFRNKYLEIKKRCRNY